MTIYEIHDALADPPALAMLPREFSYLVCNTLCFLNIFLNLVYRSQFKFRVAIGMAKCALIPWAVPCRANEKTRRLAGWSYRSLFDVVFHFLDSSRTTSAILFISRIY